MPTIFDMLYREFCRARLVEMRKQLSLWPSTAVVPEEICEAVRPNEAADWNIGPRQDWDSHEKTSRS
jgi:hypothetical protein